MDPIVYLAGVITLGIAAQWLAWRMHLPAILLLLVFGFLFLPVCGIFTGKTVTAEQLIPDDLLFPFVSISVAVILFEGGLSLKLAELRGTGYVMLRLVTIGVLVTWGLGTLAAGLVFRLDWGISALLGAVLTVSGPTVVGPLLRYVRPAPRIGSLAKWEGIVNDPVGAVLAVLVFEVLREIFQLGEVGLTFFSAASGLLKTAAVGLTVGATTAVILVTLLKRYLIPDYLQSAAFLAVVVAAFTISNAIQTESGLVTVTLLGIIMANQRTVVVKHVIEFKENLRVLLISTLFILLASRVPLEQMKSMALPGVVFVVLLLAIRGVAVYVSTFASDLRRVERLFLAWLHPRGIVAAAVSALFALEFAHLADHHLVPPDLANQAKQLVPITFLVIVGTVGIYGLTVRPVARRLGVAEPNRRGILFAGADSFVRAVAQALQDEGCQVMLVDTNQHNISTARMAGLPTCYASVLSEHVLEELELGGIGRLLAMTPNDEVNSLAAMEFIDVFGRAGVYQLSPEVADTVRQSQVSSHLRARILFGRDVTSARLRFRLATGATIKKTKLSDEFDFDRFRELYGESSVVLFVIDPSGEVTICTSDEDPAPTSGQTLVSLVDPVSETATNGDVLS